MNEKIKITTTLSKLKMQAECQEQDIDSANVRKAKAQKKIFFYSTQFLLVGASIFLATINPQQQKKELLINPKFHFSRSSNIQIGCHDRIDVSITRIVQSVSSTNSRFMDGTRF